MAKGAKKKRLSKASSRERDESSDGEMEIPPPKKVKKTEEPGSSKKGKKKNQKEEMKPPEPKKPVNFDLSQPHSVTLKSLSDVIMCSLCKGYLIDATTVVECLHSFCKSCLLNYFEEEDNHCPKCKELIHQSHPTHYVAYDRTLQDIVYKLVPGLYDAELKQRKTFERQQKIDAGEDVEAEDRRLEEKRKELEADRTNRCFEGRAKHSHHRDEPQMLIELVRGADDLPLPPKRFIRTGEMCTVTTLKRYLSYAMYGKKSRYNEMDLFFNDELMGRDYSMKFIFRTRVQKPGVRGPPIPRVPDQPLRLVYKHRIE